MKIAYSCIKNYFKNFGYCWQNRYWSIVTGCGRRGTFWNWNFCEIFKKSGYSPHSILLLNNFASIRAIVFLASFRNSADMLSIPLDEVFLRLVIQAMTSSAQVPSRTKNVEMDFINVVKDVLVGRIPFPMDTPMEEKCSLSVLLIVIEQLVCVPSFNFKLLISEDCF